jgi:hypothetical protein
LDNTTEFHDTYNMTTTKIRIYNTQYALNPAYKSHTGDVYMSDFLNWADREGIKAPKCEIFEFSDNLRGTYICIYIYVFKYIFIHEYIYTLYM